MKTTILTRFLQELGVKHTRYYSEKIYRTHPYRDSLYGLSHMLNIYGIYNEGIRSKEKKIESFSPPFIAHLSNEFVIVKKKLKDTITYEWRGIDITGPIENFRDNWSGVVLLAQPTEASKEPNYSKHCLFSFCEKIQRLVLLVFPIICLLAAYYNNKDIIGINGSLLILLNAIGIYISFLLLQKQAKVNSNYANKICSLFHQKDCNAILELPVAKIGILSWSEIGFAYFLTNILLITLFPNYIYYQIFPNLLALPYTLWSIWFQYKKVKQWCVLCLIVQILLWLTFIVNVFNVNMTFVTSLGIIPLAVLCSSYVFLSFLINIVIRGIICIHKVYFITQDYESLKNSDEVFKTLLKLQPYYEASGTSQILFGNPDSKLQVTILTNPHCEPCGRMHQRVANLLKQVDYQICIQYIFSAFDDDLLLSNRFLIAAYLHGSSKQQIEEVYNQWYMKGKYCSKEFISKYNFDLEGVEDELKKHEQWKKVNHLMATPTILVNGYLLPSRYKIEDLSYFKDIDL